MVRAASPTSAGTRAWCTWLASQSSRCPPRRCSDRRCTRPSSLPSQRGWQRSRQSNLGLERRNRLHLIRELALPWMFYPLPFRKDSEKVTISGLWSVPTFFLKWKPCYLKWHKWAYLQDRNRLTDLENELRLPEGEGIFRGFGIKGHVHTAIFKMDNQQGPTV